MDTLLPAHRILPALLLMALALAGCSGESKATAQEGAPVTVTDDTGAISGVVMDIALRPIAEAAVVLTGPSGEEAGAATTGADGVFTFEGLAPGVYILEASHPLFKRVQAPALVEAGVQPDVTKLVLSPRFSQAPYVLALQNDGYFECSQNGAGVYSSSNCVTDHCPIVMSPQTCNGLPTKAMDNLTSQQREWHMDVGPGWQGLVIEMQWQPSAQGTSPRMGMVVSTYKPLRDPTHSFANHGSASPFRLQLDVNTTHATAASVDPAQVPWEGMEDVSYFVSVRRPDQGCVAVCPPGIALQQKFQVFVHQFYYVPVPEGWSFLAGDKPPA